MIKKNASHLGGEAYQMFSQRNNPYCEFLSVANIQKKIKIKKFCLHKFIFINLRV